MSIFPMEKGMTSGAFAKKLFSQPSDQGTTVNFVHENVEPICQKVEIAGGSVVVDKAKISDQNGYYVQFIDTVENKVSLHSVD